VNAGTHPFPSSQLWLLLIGFIIWCSALVVLYAWHAIGCAFGWPVATLRLGFGLALLAHLGALSWLWFAHARKVQDPASGSTGSFLQLLIAWTTIAAVVTTALTLGPAILLKTCV
jgi:hypothetical protein